MRSRPPAVHEARAIAVRRAAALIAGAIGAGAAGGAAAAESYPAKPVRVIVAFSPGGFVDFTTRLVAATGMTSQ